VTIRARRVVPWFGSVGPALTLAGALGVVAAGALAGVPVAQLAVATAVAVAVARAADLHRPRLVLSIVEDLPGLLVAAASATVAVAIGGHPVTRFGVLCFACVVLAHTLVYAGTHLLRRHRWLGRDIVVIGTGSEARSLAVSMLSRPELGLRPVGFVSTGPDPAGQARGLPLTLLGPVATLPRIVAETSVAAVVVALPGPAGTDEAATIEGLVATPIDVYAVPTWLATGQARARHPREVVGEVPVVLLYARGTSRPVRAAKRVVEVLVALATLLVLLPVFVVLAVLVRIETGGVLDRHDRAGEHGRAVPVRGFRTRHARSFARPGTTFSVAISGRVGPVGRLLRRTRLDALPEVVWTLLRRVRWAGGVPGRRLAAAVRSAPAPRPDQTQVDAGQLTR